MMRLRLSFLLVAILLYTSTIAPFCLGSSNLSSDSFQIISLVYDEAPSSGQSVPIRITMLHDEVSIPVVTVYYKLLLNGSVPLAGWRISIAQLNQSAGGLGVGLFEAVVPNPAYGEPPRFGMRILFYVEAKDYLGNYLLTCRASDRWNHEIQDDKYIITFVDKTPPTIKVRAAPSSPTSKDAVVVKVNATDGPFGSGIEKVLLFYSIGEGDFEQMMRLAEMNVYQASIPAQPAGAKVSYYVVAYDRAGNKAWSPRYSYEVLRSVEESREQQAIVGRYLLTAIVIVAAVALILVFMRRGKVREEAVAVAGVCKHPKAMSFFMLGILGVVLWLFFELSRRGAALWGLLVGIVVVAVWGWADPRVQVLMPLKPVRLVDENPAVSLVACAYGLLGSVGLATVAGIYLGVYRLSSVYDLLVLLLEYGLGLLVAGVVLQLAWPYLKEMDISIEIEQFDKEAEHDEPAS